MSFRAALWKQALNGMPFKCFTWNYSKTFCFPHTGTACVNTQSHFSLAAILTATSPALPLFVSHFSPFYAVLMFWETRKKHSGWFQRSLEAKQNLLWHFVHLAWPILWQAVFCQAVAVLLLLLPEMLPWHLLLLSTIPMEVPGARWDLSLPLTHPCLFCAAVAASSSWARLLWAPLEEDASGAQLLFQRGDELLWPQATRLRETHGQREPQHPMRQDASTSPPSQAQHTRTPIS